MIAFQALQSGGESMTQPVNLARGMKIRMRIGMTFSVTFLCPFVLGLLLCAPSCRSTVLTSEDATLQEKIVDNLHGDHLDTITVVVSEARATLSGIVSSAAEREIAQRDAEQVEGVKAVANNVRIESP